MNINKSGQSLFLSDKTVTVDSTVNGNVYIFANDVTISGNIMGNVYILANSVDIKSQAYINSDIFVCANNVNIAGTALDVYSASKDLTFESTARILRDVSATGDYLQFGGTIYRHADLSFNQIETDSEFAVIGGNLNYSSKEATIPEAIVNGQSNFAQLKEQTSVSVLSYFENFLMFFAISAIVVVIIVLAAPKFADKELEILKTKSPSALGYGLLALIAIPIVCIILFFTIIGILPGIILLLSYIFVLSNIVSAIVSVPIAKMLCKTDKKSILISINLAVLVLIWILKQLPVLGSLVSLIIAILGLGIPAYAIFNLKKSKKIENEK